MSKIIAITNQKGGVGKTTTAINLSAILSKLGNRVLLIDFDPQSNTTSGVGIEKNDGLKTIYESLILGRDITERIIHTNFNNLDVVPANVNLSGAEVEMTNLPKREQLLKNVLMPIFETYDYIFIDCPPSLGLLTMNALTAAGSVLIPLQCEFYALEGMTQLLNTIRLIKKNLNPSLQIEGILATMYDPRNNISKQVLFELQSHFSNYLFKSVIPRNVKLSEAPSHGLPIYIYDSKSKGSMYYEDLAREIGK